MSSPAILQSSRPRSFDVICIGEPRWRTPRRHGEHGAAVVSGGMVRVARMLARTGARVAVAAVLSDDRVGRRTREELLAQGVLVDAVVLGHSPGGLHVVDAVAGESGAVFGCSSGLEPDVPPGWSSRVLLVAGASPVTSRLAALCRAARRARREGSVVVFDVVGSPRAWAGCDPRVLSALLGEADVVRCGLLELAAIGADPATVRRSLRPTATLVVSDVGRTSAFGAFGAVHAPTSDATGDAGSAEACLGAICSELARPRARKETPNARWSRILREEAPRLAASL